MDTYALIVAGGSGSRMGLELPKQFAGMAGKPLLMHTLKLFAAYDPAICLMLVLPEPFIDLWGRLCRAHAFAVPHQVAAGGENRFRSVQNGLMQLGEEGIVFIHDGVRPLVSQTTIGRCLETALRHGNAVPCIPVNESVRWQDAGSNHPVDRDKLVLIQTPQTFRLSLIRAAYRQPFNPAFTDDASVLESTGEKIHLVEGNRENIKITWPEDLLTARVLLKKRNQPPAGK